MKPCPIGLRPAVDREANVIRVGADDGTRTRNRRFTKPLLYQLSYVGAQNHTAGGPVAPGNDRAQRPNGSSGPVWAGSQAAVEPTAAGRPLNRWPGRAWRAWQVSARPLGPPWRLLSRPRPAWPRTLPTPSPRIWLSWPRIWLRIWPSSTTSRQALRPRPRARPRRRPR